MDVEPKIAVLADEDIEEDPDRWCSYTECAGIVASCLSMGVESATLTGKDDARGQDTRDRMGTCQGNSSLSRARGKPASGVWTLAAAFGRAAGRLGADTFVLQEDGTLRCPAGASLWLSEVRQENAFTQRAVSVASQMDCPHCTLREQCLGRNAKGNRARRISAVRRLLPSPSSVEQDPHLLQAIRWVDVAGRALRRTWIVHWCSQYVEILPLAEIPEKTSPPSRPPRSIRSHHRWSWHDRLARNAWWGPPLLRITVAGVPAFLAVSER